MKRMMKRSTKPLRLRRNPWRRRSPNTTIQPSMSSSDSSHKIPLSPFCVDTSIRSSKLFLPSRSPRSCNTSFCNAKAISSLYSFKTCSITLSLSLWLNSCSLRYLVQVLPAVWAETALAQTSMAWALTTKMRSRRILMVGRRN
jgi:hypothetical protein